LPLVNVMSGSTEKKAVLDVWYFWQQNLIQTLYLLLLAILYPLSCLRFRMGKNIVVKCTHSMRLQISFDALVCRISGTPSRNMDPKTILKFKYGPMNSIPLFL